LSRQKAQFRHYVRAVVVIGGSVPDLLILLIGLVQTLKHDVEGDIIIHALEVDD
jgi:hypothetical protein